MLRVTRIYQRKSPLKQQNPQALIVSLLAAINQKIGITINSAPDAKRERYTIIDVPKVIEEIYRLGDEYITFVDEELQELFSESDEDETLVFSHIEDLLGAYRSRVKVMSDLYLKILHMTVDAPFEKAQFFMLTMINHLLGSVYDFNDQMIDAFDEKIYGAMVALSIDLESQMKKFTLWFNTVKAETEKLIDTKIEAPFFTKHP